MSLNYDNIDVRTGYELIQYVNKEFEQYENIAVHYKQSLDCGYETINTFQLMITTEYFEQSHNKEREKYLGKQSNWTKCFPQSNYNFKYLFDLNFDDVYSFRNLFGDFVLFEEHQKFNDKLNEFLLKNQSISVKQFLDFFQNDFLGLLKHEDTKIEWQNEKFSFANYTQPSVRSYQNISVMDAWLTFIKLFIMDNIDLNAPKTIEQKFIIIGFNAGDGHEYED